jgi:hypothetical protein
MKDEFDKKELSKHFLDRKIIGIDPGRSAGAIVVWSFDAKKIIARVGLNEKTPKDLLEIFKFFSKNSVAFLERVGGMPGNGASRAFTFGQGYGWIETALVANRIPCENPTPQKWQKAIQCGVRGNRTEGQWKAHLKRIAESLYPNVKLTLQFSDALLICHYGRIVKNCV